MQYNYSITQPDTAKERSIWFSLHAIQEMIHHSERDVRLSPLDKIALALDVPITDLYKRLPDDTLPQQRRRGHNSSTSTRPLVSQRSVPLAVKQ